MSSDSSNPVPEGNNAPDVDLCIPEARAQQVIRKHYWSHDHSCLRWYRSDFYRWRDGRYRTLPEEDVRVQVRRWCGSFSRSLPSTDLDPDYLTETTISALKTIIFIDSHTESPCWLDTKEHPDIDKVVVCGNGILSLHDRKLIPSTPALFNFTVAPIDYDPDAKATRWSRFMVEVFGDDIDSMSTLQEWFGYLLTPDTTMQKIMMLIGKARAGKGTVGRVLTALLGSENVAGVPLANLKSNFGLWPLIDKTLAIIPDARVPRNRSAAIERLLSISGEDAITVDRKYKSHWTGKLPTRLMLVTNELPHFGDATLPTRFLLLRFPNSFRGREDPKLTDTLKGELSGILNWALDGLDRLRDRGHFIQPASGELDLADLADTGGRVASFIRDRCEVGTDYRVSANDLRAALDDWCIERDLDSDLTMEQFGRQLRAAVPGVQKQRRRVDGGRLYLYIGLRLAVPRVPRDSQPFFLSLKDDIKRGTRGTPSPNGQEGRSGDRAVPRSLGTPHTGSTS